MIEALGESDVEETIEQALPVSFTELKALSEAGNRGDQSALERLRAVLDASPEIWHRMGDIAGRIRQQLMLMITHGDHLRMECLQRQMADLRNKLGWTDGSTVERLAIDRLLACWLQQQLAAKMLLEAEAGSNNARYWLRYQAHCDRTARAGQKDLATLQRLTRRRKTAKPAKPRPDNRN